MKNKGIFRVFRVLLLYKPQNTDTDGRFDNYFIYKKKLKKKLKKY